MTDEQIVEVLEHCEDTASMGFGCINCVYGSEQKLIICCKRLIKDVISLINRQKAEIEKLRSG